MLLIYRRYFSSIISGRLRKITLSAAKQTPAQSCFHLLKTYLMTLFDFLPLSQVLNIRSQSPLKTSGRASHSSLPTAPPI